MNIGIVTDWMDTGAGVVSRQYVECLGKEHQVFIYARPLSLKKRHDPHWDLSNVEWSRKHIVPQGLWEKPFVRWLRKNNIDTVIFNEQRRWDAVCWAREAGVKVGAYVDYYTQKSVPLFALYDFLICNTKRHFSVFEWHPQAFYTPWGTDTNLFAPQTREDDAAGGVRFFISAGFDGHPEVWGNAHNRRGVEFALRAFLGVKGNARLIVHSQLSLEDCAANWQEMVQSDERIEWIHKTVRAPGLYYLGDVYLYPSKLDGIGLTLPEALSCGLAAITTDEAPMKEFVTDGENGRLIPVKMHRGRKDGYYWAESYCDEKALTGLMQAYVDDPSLVEQHKTVARQRAEMCLEWSKNSKELPGLLENVSRIELADRYNLLAQAGKAQDREDYPTTMELLLRAAGRWVRFLGLRQMLSHASGKES